MAQINKPSEHMNTKLYTGNGSEHLVLVLDFNLTGFGLNKVMVMQEVIFYDVVRGVSKYISPNSTDAESDSSLD